MDQRKPKRKSGIRLYIKTSLPKEVIQLLEAPKIEDNNQEQFFDSDDSNSDSDDEDNFCLELEVEKDD